jgi:anti-anti-sigma regulatory factor
MAPVAAPAAVLTEVVDTRTGVVRATGVLTPSGADLLRGAVETLQRLGHRRITLDLSGVDHADEEAIALLEGLCDPSAGGASVGLVAHRPARASC